MKVLYAGDAAAKIGPIFVASPFNFEVKGFSTHVWGQPLIDALEERGIEVTHMTCEVAIADFPRTVEGLSEYDVLILSDIECEVLALYPFWIHRSSIWTTKRRDDFPPVRPFGRPPETPPNPRRCQRWSAAPSRRRRCRPK